MTSFELPSCVRGYHVYRDIWLPVIGDTLQCVRERTNSSDRYAVAVKKDTRSEVVGHLPRRISRLCHLFLQRRGRITCTITGNRRYSADLPQGGLEIPCLLLFSGDRKDIKKMKKLFKDT